MKTIWNYFWLEGKRSSRMIGSMLISIFVLTVFTVLAAWGIRQWFSSTAKFDKVSIGIVIEGDDSTTRLVSRVISGMESVSSICSFEYVSQQEAEVMIQNDELQAAILLPEGFYDDVDTGVNTPVSVLYGDEVTFNKEVFTELLGDGVSMVQTTEAGVYAATDLSYIHSITMRRGKMQEFLSYIYLEAAYGRGSVFDSCMLSETGEVNLNQYYMIIAMLFLVLMGGVSFAYLYRRENKAVMQKLRLMGVHPVIQSLIHIFWMTLFIWIFLLLLYGGICLMERKLGWFFVYYDPVVWWAYAVLALSIACFYHGIYGLFEEKGTLVLLGTNAFMLICSGGIIPMVYFPEWVQVIGRKLPLAYWMEYLQKVNFGNSYHFPVLPLLVIGLLFGFVGTIRLCVNT